MQDKDFRYTADLGTCCSHCYGGAVLNVALLSVRQLPLCAKHVGLSAFLQAAGLPLR